MSPSSSSLSAGLSQRRGSEIEMSAFVVVVTVILMCAILLGLYFYYEYLGMLFTAYQRCQKYPT